MGRQQYAGQIDAGNHHPTGTLTTEAGETKLIPAVKGAPGRSSQAPLTTYTSHTLVPQRQHHTHQHITPHNRPT